MKSELKMPRDRDREVKFLENFREILENQEIKKISNFVTNAFHLANVYSGIQQNAISESICHRGFWDGPWLRHVRLCGWIELEISECTSAGGGLGWLILILIC